MSLASLVMAKNPLNILNHYNIATLVISDTITTLAKACYKNIKERQSFAKMLEKLKSHFKLPI